MEQVQGPQMTLEQIEAHIKSANLEQFNQPHAQAQDLGAQLQKVCKVYKAIKPILQAVVSFPLIPGSIKNAIKTFLSVMNTICP